MIYNSRSNGNSHGLVELVVRNTRLAETERHPDSIVLPQLDNTLRHVAICHSSRRTEVDCTVFRHCETVHLDTCSHVQHLSTLGQVRNIKIEYCELSLFDTTGIDLYASESLVWESNGYGPHMSIDLHVWSQVQNLISIHLEHISSLENHHLPILAHQLRHVTLIGCLNITDIGCLNQLETLNLSHCIHIAQGVEELGRVMQLNLTGCIEFPSQAIVALNCVQDLSLERCTQVNQEHLNALIHVQTLNLSSLPQLSCVKAFARCHTLILNNCSGIGHDIHTLQNVHTLEMIGCSKLVDISSLNQIAHLNVSNCQSIERGFNYPKEFVGQTFVYANCVSLHQWLSSVKRSELVEPEKGPELDFLDEMRRQMELEEQFSEITEVS